MSAAATVSLMTGTAPVSRRVRAYFAPVDRATGVATTFDPAQAGAFPPDSPPSPWIDLGWCSNFVRRSGSKTVELRGGSPGVVQMQARTQLEATVEIDFDCWGKLQLALSAGSEQMNLLATVPGAAANGSGGLAGAAVPLQVTGTTATTLVVGKAAAAGFALGDMVAVDVDYAAETGFVGSGVSAAFVCDASLVSGDVNYTRRVTLNVGRVVANAGGVLTLGAPLLAGVPVAGMQVSRLVGFVDREGGSFFQEWSGLFCIDGEQGDRVLFHYPRLQSMGSAAEKVEPLTAPVERFRIRGAFRALPVTDANDGAQVLCFRSYMPAGQRTI